MRDREERNRQLVRGVFRPLPTVSGGYARHVLERAREQASRQRAERPGWALGVIAGGLAVVIVLTLLAVSGRLRPPAPSPVVAPPTPTVPDRATVAYLSPTGQAGILVTWTGRVLRTFDVAGATYPIPGVGTGSHNTYPSTDGALVAVIDQRTPTTTIVDSTGTVVGSVPYDVGRWSTDAAHATCSLDVTARGATVSVVDLSNPASPRRTQHPVTGSGAPVSDGSQWWYSIGCAETTDNVSTIREVPTGRIVGHVGGTVVAFSGDSRIVAVRTGSGATPPSKLVDWRRGTTIWTAPSAADFPASRPGGSEMLVLLEGRTVIVDAHGHVAELPAQPADPHPATPVG